MSAAAFPINPLRNRIQAESGTGKAFVWALGMHLLLFGFLTFGLSWKSQTPAGLEAEIWDNVPVIKSAPANIDPKIDADEKADIALKKKKEAVKKPEPKEEVKAAKKVDPKELQKQKAEQEKLAKQKQEQAKEKAEKKLKKEKVNIVTIYRTLTLFENAGILNRVYLQKDSVFRKIKPYVYFRNFFIESNILSSEKPKPRTRRKAVELFP